MGDNLYLYHTNLIHTARRSALIGTLLGYSYFSRWFYSQKKLNQSGYEGLVGTVIESLPRGLTPNDFIDLLEHRLIREGFFHIAKGDWHDHLDGKSMIEVPDSFALPEAVKSMASQTPYSSEERGVKNMFLEYDPKKVVQLKTPPVIYVQKETSMHKVVMPTLRLLFLGE